MTDASVLEQEVTLALYFDPLPPGKDTVEVKTGLDDASNGNAEGLKKVITDAFENIGKQKTPYRHHLKNK